MDLLFEVERATVAGFEALDKALAGLGITAAGWRLLRMVARAPAALSVPRIADALRLRRQSVQRLVDDLVEGGVLEFAPNPQHRRAKLVVVPSKGRKVFSSAMQVERRFFDSLDTVLSNDCAESVVQFLVDLTAVARDPTSASSPRPQHGGPVRPEPVTAGRTGDCAALRSLLEGSPEPFLVAGATHLILQARVLATAPGWADVLRRRDGAEFLLEPLTRDDRFGEEPLSAEAFGARTLLRVVGLSIGDAIDLIDSGRMPAIQPVQKPQLPEN
jgi:DNA-binding MarR family transcriptional regulator